jgi:hypothetical protein
VPVLMTEHTVAQRLPPHSARNPWVTFRTDGTHAEGLRAGVIRGGHGGIVQTHEPRVLELVIALLQPPAVGVGRLARETAADTLRQITPGLIQGGGGEGVTTRVEGTSVQEHSLHPRGWTSSSPGPCSQKARTKARLMCIHRAKGGIMLLRMCVANRSTHTGYT